MDWFKAKMVVPTPLPELTSSHLYDETSFYETFTRDLLQAKHEVIIESPNHQDRFSHLPPRDMLLTFRAFRDRISDLSNDSRFNYVVVFKNFCNLYDLIGSSKLTNFSSSVNA